MRAVIQRVSRASVTVDDVEVSAIGGGLLVLVAVAIGDGESDVQWLANKLDRLRIFEDAGGGMNRNIQETGGEILLVSQFTLLADVRKGNRPSFAAAEVPELAVKLLEQLQAALVLKALSVKTGVFRACMKVASTNEGPVTILVDSKKLF